MRTLEQIYIANGQNPTLAHRSGKLEYHDRFGCLVWTPAEFVINAEVQFDAIEYPRSLYGQPLAIPNSVARIIRLNGKPTKNSS